MKLLLHLTELQHIFLFSYSNFDTGFIFNKSVQIAVSFTLETDGKLPIGTKLKDAITEIDKATDNGPIYYMINCTHTTHFDHVFGKMQLQNSLSTTIKCGP